MSCSGCRVLRKRCSDNCTLRSCLQWIEGGEAQGHATAFVAKYFGRAGLTNFIASVPPPQRPALFRSLFYEACGRIVNPVYGAVGLLCSGNWQACQDAAEMVLNGKTLKPLSSSPSQISHDPSATHTNHHPFSTPPFETLLRTFDQTNHLDKIDHSSFAIAPMRTTTSAIDRLHELSESKPSKRDHQTDLLVERSDSLPLPKKPLKRKTIQSPADHPHPSPAPAAPLCEALYRAGLEGGSASAVVLDLTLSSYPIASAATAAAHSKRRHKQLCTTKMAAPGSNSVSSEGSVTSLDQTPALTIFQPGSFLPPNP